MTASTYYDTLLVILKRNDLPFADAETCIGKSRLVKGGRELDKGMRPETKRWCQELLSDVGKERRFRNLHRIFKARAEAILDGIRQSQRSSTPAEVRDARALGTGAAACAIELAGRPIRIGNVLGLRPRGTRANFHRPTRHEPDFAFTLTREDTKAGKDEERTVLNRKIHGHEVMKWYLSTIRPLFPFAGDSIHLFPAVKSPDALAYGTFDTWFRSAATSAEIPMTFHLFRHGYASLLLMHDYSLLNVAADMLRNMPAVCARSYACIDKQQVFARGKQMMIESAKMRGR